MKPVKTDSPIALHIILLAIFFSIPCFAHREKIEPKVNCLDRHALCPLDPTSQSQESFCSIMYTRGLEYLSRCGPTQPGPICQPSACQQKSAIENTTPFDADKTCLAMQLIRSGIDESPEGIWKKSAEQDLKATVGYTSSGDVRYFHYVDKDTQWIVFLGSVTTTNWIANFQTGFIDAPAPIGMKVHKGFWGVASSVYSTLESLIKQNPDKKIRITGHSLGGAVAVLLSLMLAEDHTIDTLITFGQPQITTAGGVYLFNTKFSKKVPLIRFINNHDQVPFMLALINKSYFHFGAEVWLETNQDHVGFAILLKPDSSRTLAKGDNSGITDHPPISYIDNLNRLFCQI